MRIEKQLYRMTLHRFNDLQGAVSELRALLNEKRGDVLAPLPCDEFTADDLAKIRVISELVTKCAHEFNAYLNAYNAAIKPSPAIKKGKD